MTPDAGGLEGLATLRDLLDRLTRVYGPPGREAGIAREIAAIIGPHVDETWTDALGNLIAVKAAGAAAGPPAPGSGRPRPGDRAGRGPLIMLSAHMDQAGLVVTSAARDGFLRFGVAGDLDVMALPGQRVVNALGILGVVGVDEGVGKQDLASQKMYIDVGDTEETEGAALGDVFCLEPRTGDLGPGGGKFTSPALDNRAGCAVLLEVAKGLYLSKAAGRADRGSRGPGDALFPGVAFVFTVQGAIAPRGARTAAFALEPVLGITVDLTPARSSGKEGSRVEVGKGPAIRVKDGDYVAPPRVREALVETARKCGIPYQLDVSSAHEDAADASVVQVAGAGVPTGVVGLPARHARSSSPVVDLHDLEATVELLSRLLLEPPEL